MFKPLHQLDRARIWGPCFLVVFSLGTASAQQTGGTTGGDTATGGTGAAAGGGAIAPGDSAVQMDDSAFAEVDRTGTLGAASSAIGSDASERAGGGAARAGGIGGLGGLGGLGGGFGGLGNLFGNAFGAGTQTTRPPLRTRLRSAVAVAPTPPAQVQRVVNARLRSLPSQPQLRSVRVLMDGRTAVLTGNVSSDRDRRMSELLMRLEPGVSNVDNRITVSP